MVIPAEAARTALLSGGCLPPQPGRERRAERSRGATRMAAGLALRATEATGTG